LLVTQQVKWMAVAVFVAGTTAGVSAASDPSIAVQARAAGGFERIIVSTDRPLVLADLTRAADLVVEASTAAERTYLDGSETHIYTDSHFTVHAIVKNRWEPGLREGGSILVRRESGTVLIDGVPATTIENDFPPFTSESRYILFLKEIPDEKAYVVVGAGRGAFTTGSVIAPMASATEGASQPVSREAFFGELRALLKFTH
jgi:hypothetical protein